MDFPKFMCNEKNMIPAYQQNTPDIEGEYIVTVDGVEYILHAGDELFIPKGSVQGGRVKAGTRSIHAFGGQRVKA